MKSKFPRTIHLLLVLLFCPLFTGGQYWVETKNVALELDHMGSMPSRPLTSCVTLGKSAQLAVPQHFIYSMETIVGISFWGCSEDQMRQFLESTLPGRQLSGNTSYCNSITRSWQIYLEQSSRGGFLFVCLCFYICNKISKQRF